jgi:invasion protein IalB
MANSLSHSATAARWACVGAVGAALTLTAFATVVSAQTAPPAKKAAPAAPPAQKGAPAAAGAPGTDSAWVKVCDKQTGQRQGTDGKAVQEERTICSTQHEQPGVLLSISMLQVVGDNRNLMSVKLPLAMRLPEGMHFVVLTKQERDDLMAARQAGKQFDDGKLQFAKLPFTTCHPGGCVVEFEPNADQMGKLKSGNAILLKAVDVFGKGMLFLAPLEGFSQTLAGPASFDRQTYSKLREDLLRERMQARAQEEKQAALTANPELAGMVKEIEDAQKALADEEKKVVTSNPKLQEAAKKLEEAQRKLQAAAQAKQAAAAQAAPAKAAAPAPKK